MEESDVTFTENVFWGYLYGGNGYCGLYKDKTYGIVFINAGHVFVAWCYKGRAHGVARCYEGRAHGVGNGQKQTRGDPVRAGCRSACNGQMARLAPQFGQQVSSARVGDARECETGPAVLLADGSD